MNQIVRSWNRSHSKLKYNGPDAVVVDDEIIVLTDSGEEMAVRKKTQTAPVLDNSSKEKEARKLSELSKEGFETVIKWIHGGSLLRVHAICTSTHKNLKRLKVSRNKNKKIATFVKSRSDQVDVGTLVRWMDSIKRTDKLAVCQLVAIDATCCARG